MAVHISDTGIIARIHKESYNSVREKQLNKKWAKDLNRHFIKEDAQMANKHLKSCSAPSIIRDIRIKLQGDTTAHPTEWVNYLF